MSTEPIRWYIAAPFLHKATDPWLTQLVPNQDRALEFELIPANYVHDRSRKMTGPKAWVDYMRHANETWRAAAKSGERSGVITSFPQLPVTVGLRKRLALSRKPLVAWTFNLGKLYPGLRRHLSRAALLAVDRFIVHSRAEV